MQLSRLSLADLLTIDWHLKRSLLQFHILFLGLFIEPYWKCLLDLAAFCLNGTLIRLEDLETLRIVEEQCVLAARQSAWVASLPQIDYSIRSCCWVSVYVNSLRNCSTSSDVRLVLGIPASLVARYFYSVLRRSYSSYLEKRLGKT